MALVSKVVLTLMNVQKTNMTAIGRMPSVLISHQLPSPLQFTNVAVKMAGLTIETSSFSAPETFKSSMNVETLMSANKVSMNATINVTIMMEVTHVTADLGTDSPMMARPAKTSMNVQLKTVAVLIPASITPMVVTNANVTTVLLWMVTDTPVPTSMNVNR